MRFRLIAETLDVLERISSRIQMTNTLVELFRNTPKEYVDKVIYFLQGQLWPPWKGMPELGLGEKLLVKVISASMGVQESQVEDLLKREGDLGRVAELLKKGKSQAQGLAAFLGRQAGEGLTVDKVYGVLARVATAIGEGSRDLKIRLLSGLLKEAEPIEARYIIRFVQGAHRVGVGDMTILDALAIAYAGSGTHRPIIERAYNLRADLGMVSKILVERGVEELAGIRPEVGVPVKPMLAERHNDPAEMLEKVDGRCIVEYKYDGERAQLHKGDGRVIIFSRHLENISHMYPEVVDAARDAIKVDRAIVEGEIVGIDPDSGEMLPFQMLMTRKRKYDIQRAMKEVPVKVFLFDALLVGEEDLTVRPLTERKRALESIIEENDVVKLAQYTYAETPQDLDRFFLSAVSEGAEGVMVKAIHPRSVYQAGNRGWLWIKYKRDYKSEMIDTVDLVVVGAFYGKGRRGGKLSTLLMAAYDPDTDTFRTVCKVGTGFTDEEIERMRETLEPYVIPNRHFRVVSEIEPDIWLTPSLVAEVLGAEITLSPLHVCAKGVLRGDAGISIRFPRFIKWRGDKRPEDATSCQELVEMYKMQLKKVTEAETPEKPL